MSFTPLSSELGDEREKRRRRRALSEEYRAKALRAIASSRSCIRSKILQSRLPSSHVLWIDNGSCPLQLGEVVEIGGALGSSPLICVLVFPRDQ